MMPIPLHPRPASSSARRRPARLLAPLLSLLFLAAPPPARAADAPDTFGHRRPLNFRIIPSDAPGENIAVADFYIDAAHQPDGSDLRVITPAGVLVPMQVLFASGAHDRVRIAFATRSDGPYFVTWDNKPDKPAPPLDVRRGIFAEAFPLPAGNFRTADFLDQALARATLRTAANFINELSIGFAPAGPQDDVLLRYTAQFKVDRPGSYDIAFSVSKGGYLAIDGKTIVSEFSGRMIRDARNTNTKSIDLTAGWHSLLATQANRNGGETGLEVAWRKTGDPRFVTLPAGAPAAKAADGLIESLNPTPQLQADFSIDPAAEGFFTPDTFCPRFIFDARIPAGHASDRLSFDWNFGDGQTSSIRRPNHFFLSPGIYPITLTMQIGSATVKATRRLLISDRLIDLFPTPPEDQPKAISSTIDSYDPAKLSASSALRGVFFYQKQNRDPEFLHWGNAWLQKKDTQDQNIITDMAIDLAQKYLDKGDSPQAAAAMELASQKNIFIDARARLMHRAVILYAGEAAQPEKAAALAKAWDDNLTSTARPIILAAQAYAAIATGDGKRARDLVALSADHPDPARRQLKQLDEGVMTRNVEAYIRTKDYEEAAKILDNWEIQYPDAIIEGFSRLQRFKLLLAQDRPLTAARIAMDHARALPDSFYAAELLYRASEAYRTAAHPADAKAALDLLKSKYPESPYANDKAH